jgi:multicomponent Na+:H+ antiporter subunit C
MIEAWGAALSTGWEGISGLWSAGVSVWLPTGSALVLFGLLGMLLAPSILRKLLAFNVMGSGIFVLLLALRPPGPSGVADPVAQALILTGIVIAIAATALGVRLARRYFELTGQTELPEDRDAARDD